MHEQPSSICPLQLSSIPLHVSVPGCEVCVQVVAPPVQAVMPASHTPGLPVLHAWPAPGSPLSTTPSQSSSCPLQVSSLEAVACTHASAPLAHAVVPGEQTPGFPVRQVTPAPGLPLSTVPSQSSSLPLHVSALARTVCEQETAPPLHTVTPGAHTPTLPVWHACPPPGLPLSTVPSQSSSLPLHVSPLACVVCAQPSDPPLHVVVPAAQTPDLPVTQARPLPGLASSTVPLQSSSLPLQSSVCAATFARQATAPLTHAVVPGAQMPGLAVVHDCPPPGLASSTRPLQSSSLPLQTSPAGTTSPVQPPHSPPAHVCVPAWQGPTPRVAVAAL